MTPLERIVVRIERLERHEITPPHRESAMDAAVRQAQEKMYRLGLQHAKGIVESEMADERVRAA